ncbi:MAG: aquaporin [Clostridium sp.]|nr:aquaporin [Clostridium sp.]
MNKYLMEFIGTFFLVLTVGCVIAVNGGTPFAPLAIGAILMIMVYAGGKVSGGHYNPAVSASVAIRGALEFKELLPYFIAQILGATAASLLVMFFTRSISIIPGSDFDILPLIIGEFLFTFALAFVVLMTATYKANSDNSYFGIAIGFTVTAGILTFGTLAPCAFNPAVAFSLGLLHITTWKIALITIFADLFGGILAAFAYYLVTRNDE